MTLRNWVLGFPRREVHQLGDLAILVLWLRLLRRGQGQLSSSITPPPLPGGLTKDNVDSAMGGVQGAFKDKLPVQERILCCCVAIAYLPRIVECGLILFSQIGLGLGLAGVQATLTQRQRLVKVVVCGLFSPRLCWLPSASHLLCSLGGSCLAYSERGKAENAPIIFCNFWKVPAVSDLQTS